MKAFSLRCSPPCSPSLPQSRRGQQTGIFTALPVSARLLLIWERAGVGGGRPGTAPLTPPHSHPDKKRGRR